MNKDFLNRISQLSPKRLALLAMDLQTKLDASEQKKSESIAIIGMGCRFPGGANSPETYWQLLQEGRDAITEVPLSRWNVDSFYDPNPEAPGKMATRWGGFIENVDQFDPQFFGISPREALSMDPQQRLLLEVAWEALEHAGYSPEKLSGSSTGVFVGICNNDYYQLLLGSGAMSDIDVYRATGSAFSVASGRISYVLGLRGPSLSVDTACSSSLVALHLAIQSLRNRECGMALAAGVNLILSPEVTIILSQSSMMSADGRCKTFDAAADGFVRSEGCGVVALKLLSDATAAGDNILAIIRGSAINQDGRSNGITAPNGPSQEAVIRAAITDAGVDAGDIGYIETHGTGTSLGDPIEVQALGKVFRSDHSKADPVMIGSVKTNFGHMESAAGIAGLIKLVLTLQHGEIPPHLHLKKPNPYIAWDEYPVAIPTVATPWIGKNGRRVGGISSFGFSGTNVHMVLESAPTPKRTVTEVERPTHILALSAKSELALKEMAARSEDYLEKHPSESITDICYTSNVGRSHSKYRLAIVADDPKGLREMLAVYQAGRPSRNLFRGHMQGNRPPEVVFLFTGQGAQYAGMGRQLYQTQPTFRRILERCDELLSPYLGQSLISILYGESDAATLLDDIAYAQPLLFAFQYALAQLWQSWGIKPAAVMGHSAGEYVAACVAGVFSLEDGLKLSSARGRLMKNTSPGTMVNIITSQERVKAAIAPFKNVVSIAAVNGPENIVISGERTAIQLITDELKTEGIKTLPLNISIAGHSPLMESILDEFGRIAAGVTYSAPQIELISGLSGLAVGSQELNAEYWCRHMREAIQFYPAITNLQQQGFRAFVEIGPAPILTGMAQQCLPSELQKEITWITSLRPKYEDWTQMLKSLGALYSQGVHVDWDGFEHDYAAGRHRIPLPTYPFQRSRYWVDATKSVRPTTDSSLHPLLGKQLKSPSIQDIVFETRINASWPAYLAHHRIFGIGVLPSPAYLEMVLEATREIFGNNNYAIQDFVIQQALILPEDELRSVQLILTPHDGKKEASFSVVSLDDDTNQWTVHATGMVGPAEAGPSHVSLDLETIRSHCPEQISSEEFYEKVTELGLEFGSDFRGLTKIWKGDNEALGLMQLPKTLITESALYQIHPAFLDSCFHLLGAPLGEVNNAFLLVGIDRFQLYQTPDTVLWNHTILHQNAASNHDSFTGTVRLFNENGDLVAQIEGLHLRRAERETILRSVRKSDDDWFYKVEWQPKPFTDQSSAQRSSLDLLNPHQIAQIVTPDVAQLSSDYKLSEYRQLLSSVDRLIAAYIVGALQSSGIKLQSGDKISVDDLIETFGVPSRHYLQRLLPRLLEILNDVGLLKPLGSEWELIQTPEFQDTKVEWASLITRYPSHEAQLNLINQCGPYLADVLRGEKDALDLLFPNGSISATEKIYQEAPFAQAYNKLMKQAIQAALSRLPRGQTIRILEIGAGSGGTTNSILPILDPASTEYIFTDLSPRFTTLASEKFRNYTFVRYGLLDIERKPTTQGFDEQQFDLIIAANVLHATSDLRQTLTHVKSLLAPGGILFLLEGTSPQPWVDITFGLTEGWWKFTDTKTLRPAYPLLSQNEWLALLLDMGFSESVSIPADSDQMVEQAVIISQNPVSVTSYGEPGDWLIFADNTGLGQQLGMLLEQRGDHCVYVSPGQEYKALGRNHWQLDPSQAADFDRLMAETSGQYQKIVHLWSLEKQPAISSIQTLEASQSNSCGSALLLVQALAKMKYTKFPSLWLVTQGAQMINTTTDSPPNIAQTSLWGLGRVIALEHPEIWGGLVDLDTKSDSKVNALQVLSEIQRSDGEDQTAWRSGQRYVCRLVRTGRPSSDKPTALKDGSYLITGGLGGLGLKVAHWLAEHGARFLVLTARHELPEKDHWASLAEGSPIKQQVDAIQAMEALGATVIVESADVSDPARMRDLFQQFGRSIPPLRGIVHAAADLSNRKLRDMPLESLHSMLGPKVTGTWILHELTQDMNLDFFVLFSSTTALWGSDGLGHYAAANTFLDGFAHYRHSLGLPAISINWGTWDKMRIATQEDQNIVASFGLKQMASTQVLAIMGDLLNTVSPQFVVAAVDWNVLKPLYEAKRHRPFMEQVSQPISESNRKTTKKTSGNGSRFLQSLKTARPADRAQIITGFVRTEVSRILDFASDQSIDLQLGLFDMGLDSLMAIELKNQLELGIEQSLPSTLIFNYPTITDLASYLGTKLSDLPEKNETDVEKPSATLSVMESKNMTDTTDLSEEQLANLLMNKLRQIE